MKRALVFGAGGFIGSHMVQYLVEKGYFVKGVGKHVPKCSHANSFATGDCRNADFVESVFKDEEPFDEVYQFAAEMGGTIHINTGLYDADIMANSALINIHVAKNCVVHKAKRLFFASSACVYSENMNEEDAYPANPKTGYGWEKIFSEQLLKSFGKQYGIIVRIARLHSIIGENSQYCDLRGRAHTSLAYKVAKVADGEDVPVIGDGTQVRTFLYVKDCVEGIHKLMLSDCDEPINIGSDIPFTINEYIEILRKVSGKTFRIEYKPGPVGANSTTCQLNKAKKMLSWEPKTSLEEATRYVYNWLMTDIQSQS